MRNRVAAAIEAVEAASQLSQITNLEKLSGVENCYRLRVGDYRIGLWIEADTVEFVRCLHRRDLYRYFP